MSDSKLKIRSVIQLSTEIEAIKKQELVLLTKVEMQRYTESEMKTKLAELQEQLEDCSELVRGEVRKLQAKYNAVVVEEGYDDIGEEMSEHIEKFSENLQIYKQIVRDPMEYLKQIHLETTAVGDERIQEIVEMALNNRHLTADEWDTADRKAALEMDKDEAMQKDNL